MHSMPAIGYCWRSIALAALAVVLWALERRNALVGGHAPTVLVGVTQRRAATLTLTQTGRP